MGKQRTHTSDFRPKEALKKTCMKKTKRRIPSSSLLSFFLAVCLLSHVVQVRSFLDPFSGDGDEGDGWHTPSPDTDEQWTTGADCIVSGDPHIMTFDDTVYSFQDRSSRYTYVAPLSSAVTPDCPNFLILGSHEAWRFNSQMSTLSKVELIFPDHDTTFKILSNGKLMVNGVKRSGDFDLTAAGTPTLVCLIRQSQTVVTRVTCNCGIDVTFGASTGRFCLPIWYMSQVYGLCGNFDGVAFQGDPLCSTSEVETDPTQCSFDKSILVRSKRQAGLINGVPSGCTTDVVDSVPMTPECNMLTDETGPFADCASNTSLGFDNFLRNCKIDICAAADTGGKCLTMESVSMLCTFLGYPASSNWRDTTTCAAECPAGMEYKTSQSACVATCSNPNPPTPCPDNLIDGCFCPEGQLQLDDECRKPSECPCFETDGRVKELNSKWLSGDCSKVKECTAGKGNTVPSITDVSSNTCQTGETCQLVDDNPTCSTNMAYAHLIGLSHYRTLDGYYYHYEGGCLYDILGTTKQAVVAKKLNGFRILLKNSIEGDKYSKLEYVELRLPDGAKDETVKVDKDGNVWRGTIQQTPPFAQAIGTATVTASFIGEYVVLETNFGLKLQVGGYSEVSVYLPDDYVSYVYGLFGNFNRQSLVGDPYCFTGGPGSSLPADCKVDEPVNVGCVETGEIAHPCTKITPGSPESSNCALITDETGPFKNCIAGSRYEYAKDQNSACVFDSCAKLDDLKTVRCNFLAALAFYCFHEGFEDIKWRLAAGCEPTCPENLIYSVESSCQASCTMPDTGSCTDPQVEGCICATGTIRHGDKCVAPENCPCFETNGKEHAVGSFWISDDCATKYTCAACDTCTLKIPKPTEEVFACPIDTECEQYDDVRDCYDPSSRKCIIYNSPLYTSFDGALMNFPRTCTYNMVTTITGSISGDQMDFSIHSNNEVPGSNTIRLEIDGKVIQIDSDGNVWVDGVKQSGDFELTLSRGFKLTVSNSGLNVRLQVPDVVAITFSKSCRKTVIEVPSTGTNAYRDKVHGLCGDLNWNSLTGEPYCLNTEGEFISDFTVCQVDADSCVAVINPPDTCSDSDRATFSVDDQCGVIKRDSGPFTDCLASLSQEIIDTHVEHCLLDLCSSRTICCSLESLAYLCSQKGHIVTWRDEFSACTYTCPSGMDFKPDAAGCQSTCADPTTLDPCPVIPTEGCECPSGQIIYGENECREYEACPCVAEDGTEYQLTEDWYGPGCTKRYQCLKCEFPWCTDVPPVPHTRSLDEVCPSPKVCEPRDGVLGCYNVAVDGQWGTWGEWTVCSDSPDGYQRRTRQCDSPPPSYGGKDCGTNNEEKIVACIVDGGWTEWGAWDPCSRLAGGQQIRKRSCTNPEPKLGGKDCEPAGADTETRNCGCFLPFGTAAGDTLLPAADDAFTEEIRIDNGIQFGEELYLSFRMGTNGLVSWGGQTAPFLFHEPFPVEVAGTIMAPILADFDLKINNLDEEDNIGTWHVYSRITESTVISPEEKAVFDQAQDIVRASGDPEFVATHVVVCTWSNVVPFDSTTTILQSWRTSFQLVVVQDMSFFRSYATMLFEGSKLPVPTHIADARSGIQTADLSFVYEPFESGRPELFSLSTQNDEGGCDTRAIRLTTPSQESPMSAEYLCLRWSEREEQMFQTNMQQQDQFFPPCPCFYIQAIFHPWYIPFPYARNTCIVTRLVIIPGFLGGRVCCYESTRLFAPLVTEERFADPFMKYFGSLIHFNPYLSPAQYFQEDLLPKAWCCLWSDYCDEYYKRRPINTCQSFIPPIMLFIRGDPHYITFDGFEYSFNGKGEFYHVITTDGFITQIRNILIEDDTPKATVIGGVVAKFKNSQKMQVVLNEDRSSMILTANGTTDYTVWFYTDTPTDPDTSPAVTDVLTGGMVTADDTNVIDSIVEDKEDPSVIDDNNGFTLTKQIAEERRFLIVTFTDVAVSLRLSVRARQLVVEMFAVEELKGKTRGLLGNYNGIAEDDLIASDGTLLPSTSSMRDIHYDFGETWRVSESDSLFTYPTGKGYEYYNDPTFVPAFETVFPTPEQEADAKAQCGEDTQCLYDYSVTLDPSFAAATKQVKEIQKENEAKVNNKAPKLAGPSTIKATVGEQFTASFTATDEDPGDTVTITNENLPDGAMFVSDTFTWTPTDRTTYNSLAFYAKDSRGAEAIVLRPTIIVCDCSGHAECDFNMIESTYKKTDRFQVVKCMCEPPWKGDRCDGNTDGCLNNPCMGGTCVDMLPDLHKSSGIAFKCATCTTGFKLMKDKCIDSDECSDNGGAALCDLQKSECVNKVGSYECKCKPGYNAVAGSNTCEDIDECELGLANCEQACQDTEGSYECVCHAGNVKDESGKCNPHSSIVDTCNTLACEGGCREQFATSSVECFCPEGTELNTDKKTCKDVDECATNPCGAQGICALDPPFYTCSCEKGFQLDGSARACTACPSDFWGEKCVGKCNCKESSTQCYPASGCAACRPGYKGGSCDEDVDECGADPNKCSDKNSFCENTVGSFSCTCKDGYVKDGEVCVLEDYCQKTVEPCQHGGMCNTAFKSVTCTCIDGFVGDICETNTNECASNPCQNGGTCRDHINSFFCDCPSTHGGPICDAEIPIPSSTTTTTSTTTTAPTTAPTAPFLSISSSKVFTVALELTRSYVDDMANPSSAIFQDVSTKVPPKVEEIYSAKYGNTFLGIFNTRLSQASSGSTTYNAEVAFAVPFDTPVATVKSDLDTYLTENSNDLGGEAVKPGTSGVTGVTPVSIPLNFKITNRDYTAGLAITTSDEYITFTNGLKYEVNKHAKLSHHEKFVWSENYVYQKGSVDVSLFLAALPSVLSGDDVKNKLQNKVDSTGGYLGPYQLSPSSISSTGGTPTAAPSTDSGPSDGEIAGMVIGGLLGLILLILLIILIIYILRRKRRKEKYQRNSDYDDSSSGVGGYPRFLHPRRMHWQQVDTLTNTEASYYGKNFATGIPTGTQATRINWDVLRGYGQYPNRRPQRQQGPSDEFFWTATDGDPFSRGRQLRHGRLNGFNGFSGYSDT